MKKLETAIVYLQRIADGNNSKGVDYMLLIYGKQTQEYIVQNLEKILCGEVAE